MQSSSGTWSPQQVVATPTSEFAFSSASSTHGGSGSGKPPPLPRFNPPDSFWEQRFRDQHRAQSDHRALSNAERLLEQVTIDHIARIEAQSHQAQDNLLKAIEKHQEDKENDPRSRIQGPLLQPFRPIQFPDFVLPPDIFVELVVLKDPDNAEPETQASTSSTSTTTAAAQQAVASGGCCIPPGCNIV
jgi:hypothetical protein